MNGFKRLVIIMFLIEFVRSAFLVGYLPAIAVGGAVIAASTAVTAHFLSDAGANVFMGHIMRLIKEKGATHLGFLLAIIGLFLTTTEQLWALIVGSCLLGIGMVPVWIIALCKASGENRGKRMAVLYSFWMAGLATGAVASNLLIDVSNAWVFWIMVGMVFIGWVVMSTVSPPEAEEVVERKTTSFKEKLKAFTFFGKHSSVLLPGIVLTGVASGMLVTLLPIFAKVFLSSSQFGLVLAVGGAAALVTIVPLGKLADKIGHMPPVIIGFALCSLSLFLLADTPNGWVVFVDACLLGLGYATFLPAWNAFMAAFVHPTRKQEGWGVINSVQGASVMIGPIVGGLITQFWSIQGALLVSAILIGLTALYYFGYSLRGQRPAGI
ncbi:MFS transporter [Aureibacillus halotolerans]|uniref:Putative MFS family arabinose efflux permease n=1 Tax=Aureibacillus halotolerans TaxID=1508390 RepID=A0A4R6U0G0_9BACI|nr:MFS transporter [Aureibacillus halotolerans]TDQ38692.1 putative MFS family arabinose efflux permease [Aureibacillus halotolerans]